MAWHRTYCKELNTYPRIGEATHVHLFVEELHDSLFVAPKGNISHVDSASLASDRRVDGHGDGNVTSTAELPTGSSPLHQRVDRLCDKKIVLLIGLVCITHRYKRIEIKYLSLPVALSWVVFMMGVSMGIVPAACMALYWTGVTWS